MRFQTYNPIIEGERFYVAWKTIGCIDAERIEKDVIARKILYNMMFTWYLEKEIAFLMPLFALVIVIYKLIKFHGQTYPNYHQRWMAYRFKIKC